jgi:hypothetical protein
MKIAALLLLLPALFSKPKPPVNPADYTQSMQVVCSTAINSAGTGTGLGQRIGGFLNGKPVELLMWEPSVGLPLQPGTYRLKPLGPDKSVTVTSHEVNENYEFLLDDTTVRGYRVIGVGTTGCGATEQQ